MGRSTGGSVGSLELEVSRKFKNTGEKQASPNRLDQHLFHSGLVESRTRARALIMAGKVRVNGERITKPGHSIKDGLQISIDTKDHPFVSRGGLKLQAGLEALPVDFVGLCVMDVGASTGGFTDCLLQHGVSHVIAVDVGYGQLHWKLRTDPRVTVLERTNIRRLEKTSLERKVQGAVIDVSFISLRIVLPSVLRLLEDKTQIIGLIKPQFELEREAVGKNGVVKENKDHMRAIESVKETALRLGLELLGCIPSPILGPKGNREFLIAAGRGFDSL